jgi:hypothetical protein
MIDGMKPETVTELWAEMRKAVARIQEQRDEIITAFIAKYQVGPDEIEQVEQRTPTGSVWYVRRRAVGSLIVGARAGGGSEN